MKTLFRAGTYSILKLFYLNKNLPLHLREIARKADLNESTITKHLNKLTDKGILRFQREGNLKKFNVKVEVLPLIFPMFDYERLEGLPVVRKNAIKEYLSCLKFKPLLLIIFGSTAKGRYREDSDIDVLEIVPRKNDNKEAKQAAESLSGLNLQILRVPEADFYRELKEKKDRVIQSAISTGFPVFNAKYFYEVMFLE